MSFASKNVEPGQQLVIIHSKWGFKDFCDEKLNILDIYIMDAGAYDHEEEVMMCSGTSFFVESVEQIEDDGQGNYILITLNNEYFHNLQWLENFDQKVITSKNFQF